MGVVCPSVTLDLLGAWLMTGVKVRDRWRQVNEGLNACTYILKRSCFIAIVYCNYWGKKCNILDNISLMFNITAPVSAISPLSRISLFKVITFWCP